MKRRQRNEALQAALNRLDLTPESFARLIGVTPRTVQLWLSGTVEITMPAQIIVRLLLREKITVGELYVMQPVAVANKKEGKYKPSPADSRKRIWDKLHNNAKRVVQE